MLSWLSSMRSSRLVRHPLRYAGTWLLHIALATIVVGACVTHFWGVQGEIHLRADKAQTLKVKRQSVSLFLWDFQVVTDDKNNPVDYITELRLLDRSKAKNQKAKVESGTIRMNKPLKFHGFRFCQSDYDSDRLGVVLAYNYDPWGIGITYTGYALLLVAMIGFFFQRQSYFRTLIKKQHTWLMVGLSIAIVVLALVMTKVVTPKPPLQPVLQTPLLGIHVSVIMLAYTLFAVIMVNGVLGLSMPKKRESLMQLSQVLLYPALFCLTAGIFIGAVWANMSWGRYWGWDPKETWALITMLVYALLLHWPWLMGKLGIKNEKLKIKEDKAQILYHTFSVIAFLFVLFTYFGVSYLLGGLHSYA